MKFDHLILFHAKQFTWVKNRASVDVTDLIGQSQIRHALLRQIYPDACDCGFAVQGKYEKIVFLYQEDLYYANEKIGWRFVSLDDERTGKTGKYIIDIMND